MRKDFSPEASAAAAWCNKRGLYLDEAIIFHALRDGEKAAKALERAAEQHEKAGQPYRAAKIYIMLGNKEKAMACANEFVRGFKGIDYTPYTRAQYLGAIENIRRASSMYWKIGFVAGAKNAQRRSKSHAIPLCS